MPAEQHEFDLSQTDRLLSTTKAVSSRLDLTRPVPTDLVLDCIDIASRAPLGGNREANRWMVVRDPELKQAIAEIYASVGRPYLAARRRALGEGATAAILDAGQHLVDHIAEVPLLVIPVRFGRIDPATPAADPQSFLGSVIPAVWSFQLAARSRGFGTRYTTFHLARAARVAEILGIPDDVTQVALIPVAYFTGTGFSPAKRRPAEEITYLDGWQQPLHRVSVASPARPTEQPGPWRTT